MYSIVYPLTIIVKIISFGNSDFENYLKYCDNFYQIFFMININLILFFERS